MRRLDARARRRGAAGGDQVTLRVVDVRRRGAGEALAVLAELEVHDGRLCSLEGVVGAVVAEEPERGLVLPPAEVFPRAESGNASLKGRRSDAGRPRRLDHVAVAKEHLQVDDGSHGNARGPAHIEDLVGEAPQSHDGVGARRIVRERGRADRQGDRLVRIARLLSGMRSGRPPRPFDGVTLGVQIGRKGKPSAARHARGIGHFPTRPGDRAGQA